MIDHTNSVPEQGQLVTVRQRRYVVTEIQQSSLPPSPLALSPDTPQHLVSLRSIEDDALGKTLDVIWELEPGSRVEETVGLPPVAGFDSPERLDAFSDAVRWGAVSSADMRALQAPFRSGIEIEDYQLDPLVRAIQMPRVNLLIADDVGLGKTIEAGLIIQVFAEEWKMLEKVSTFQTTIKAELKTVMKGIDEIAQIIIGGLETVLQMKSPYPDGYQEVVYKAIRHSPGCGFKQLLSGED